MKKLFFILAFVFVLNQSIFSQDQDTEQKQYKERKVTIQVNPLLWFIDIFSDENSLLFAMDLESQFKVTDGINISLDFSFLFYDNTTAKNYEYYTGDNEKIYQMSLKPMFIYRPFETGLKGFYIGLYPNIGLLHVENDEKNQFYAELGFGLNLGYKWVFKRGFTMQLGCGAGKTFRIPKDTTKYLLINSDGSIALTYTDIQLLDFKIGYSF